MSNEIIKTDLEYDLNALFEKDPLEITEPELEHICNKLRKHCHKFALEERSAKRAGRRPKHAVSVSLDNLKL